MIGDARNNQWSIEGLKTGDTWMTRAVCGFCLFWSWFKFWGPGECYMKCNRTLKVLLHLHLIFWSMMEEDGKYCITCSLLAQKIIPGYWILETLWKWKAPYKMRHYLTCSSHKTERRLISLHTNCTPRLAMIPAGVLTVLGSRRLWTFLFKYLYHNRNTSQILQVIKDNVKQMPFTF